MARGRRLRKGLTLGLYAGVAVAVVRAVRARRSPQVAQAPPTWPPLPALADPPRPTPSPVDGPSRDPGAGSPALLAEAAVLEAAGITEGAEVDEEAVLAWRAPDEDRSGPAGAGTTDDVLAAWPAPDPSSLLEAAASPEAESAIAGGTHDEAPWAAALLDDVVASTAPAPADPVV
ncbi:MAG: hypothetical protein WKF86_10660, partial [Acidimicrobiales bacterium]